MNQAFVHHVEVEYSQDGFARAIIELLIPAEAGFNSSDIMNLDWSKVFSAPSVQAAVKNEVKRKLRTISLTD